MSNSTIDEEHLLHCPKLDTDQQVLKNTIKLYLDDITSPPFAIRRTTTTNLDCFKPIRGKKQFRDL
jgi:hypothetical protein